MCKIEAYINDPKTSEQHAPDENDRSGKNNFINIASATAHYSDEGYVRDIRFSGNFKNIIPDCAKVGGENEEEKVLEFKNRLTGVIDLKNEEIKAQVENMSPD